MSLAQPASISGKSLILQNRISLKSTQALLTNHGKIPKSDGSEQYLFGHNPNMSLLPPKLWLMEVCKRAALLWPINVDQLSDLPAFCVIIFATVTVLYVIDMVPQDWLRNETSFSPIKICFKDHSVTNSDMKCDIPLKIVPNEASAQVVI
ncbi:hypothetical protein PGTUg99_008175 [Puccinia graminis f. sp. tritici]|uniref:Uncharacterized protein n=1 Tax=Puccinia graminis f. sp. tritici TaxID=56615 RepID=A0A5B0RB43_PUCGR|nr:hypothetical protein PGTUg99_008175 [Puccinia graminis f. sp. tritici]